MLRASLETAMGQASGFSLLKVHVIMPVIGNKDKYIWRSSLNVLLSVNRSCFKLFLFSTVLLNITLLKMGFIVVQWENEDSVSVLNEKKVVGAVELKEGTINS